MHSNFPQPSTLTPIAAMNTMQPCTNLTELKSFKFETLSILRTAIAQRKKLIKLKKYKLILDDEQRKIMTLYGIYRNGWEARTLAKFIVRHYDAIHRLIPGSNPTLKQRFLNQLQIAETLIHSL